MMGSDPMSNVLAEESVQGYIRSPMCLVKSHGSANISNYFSFGFRYSIVRFP